MPITTYDGMLEAWAEGLETLEQNFETLYGPSGITPTLPSITTKDGMLEAIAEEAERSTWNFARTYNATTTETQNAYTVDVPDGAMYYAGMVTVGGNTIAESEELLSAEVTEIVSKDADGNVIDTLPIPAEVLAIPGYGYGAGSANNYIDFPAKKFVNCVDSVDLGTLTWSYATVSGKRYYYSQDLMGIIAPPETSSVSGNAVCPKYVTRAFTAAQSGSQTCIGIAGQNSVNKGRVGIYDADIQSLTGAEFKDAMSGVYLYYELETSVETDISSYINKIDVKIKPGGTITFVNENEMDVPSEVRYLL